jgi:hypothetical protein
MGQVAPIPIKIKIKRVNNKKRVSNNKGRLTWALLIILGKALAFFTAGFSIYKFKQCQNRIINKIKEGEEDLPDPWW